MQRTKETTVFVGVVYQFTYNNHGKFTQSQLGLLLNLPTQADIDRFRKIPTIMVAPPGIKVVEFDDTKTTEEYISEGWVQRYVGSSP